MQILVCYSSVNRLHTVSPSNWHLTLWHNLQNLSLSGSCLPLVSSTPFSPDSQCPRTSRSFLAISCLLTFLSYMLFLLPGSTASLVFLVNSGALRAERKWCTRRNKSFLHSFVHPTNISWLPILAQALVRLKTEINSWSRVACNHQQFIFQFRSVLGSENACLQDSYHCFDRSSLQTQHLARWFIRY